MKISVLMACYNPIREYFEISIQSILNQTYKNFELIIVDDGSENLVIDLLNDLNIKDSRVKVIRNEKNIGLAKALNLGLEYCSGQYIARMDDDDIAYSDRLEKQLNFVCDNIETVGNWSGYKRITEKGEFIENGKVINKPNDFLEILIYKGNQFVHSTLFIKKEVIKYIGGYDENLRYAQDSDLYIRILEKYNMGYIDECLLDFRVNKKRQSLYKDSFSTICSLFGAYSFYLRNYDNYKYRYLFYLRMLRFIVYSVILYPIRNISKDFDRR
ncbi:glycosyltransferase [Clostridium perfringens]|nr:glycosyltransferase [Clostridium perfringens]